MTADEIENYIPGETILRDPQIVVEDPAEFCVVNSVSDAERRFNVYKKRTFTSSWLDKERFNDKCI